MITEADFERTAEALSRLQEAIGSVIVGHERVVRAALIGLLTGGNILLEGVPGLGKTLLVRSLASALDLRFSRIQFTPDLMPADIIGTDIITERDGRREFSFSPGPVFAHIVLADEINRATPKTQSALLEAMEERTVTVGTSTYPLEEPFLVLATQNPIEMEGTYPLPEAQVDRFLLKALVSYPSLDQLVRIAERNTEGDGIQLPPPVAEASEILVARQVVRGMPMGEGLRRHAARLVMASHPGNPESPQSVRDYVEYGASPRGAVALINAAKAEAFLDGEASVRRADLETVFRLALQHRLILNFRGEAEGISVSRLLDDVWEETPIA
jgi:MoxR-like ATPase